MVGICEVDSEIKDQDGEDPAPMVVVMIIMGAVVIIRVDTGILTTVKNMVIMITVQHQEDPADHQDTGEECHHPR